MIPLYDAHNHLQDERLAGALENILEELPRRGLEACVVNGTCEKDWPVVEALAKRYSWIVPAFGLHPWFARERSPRWLETLQRFLDGNSRASVGEVGLDRWMRDPDVDDQEKVFLQQLELATQRNVAVSIHCLKAWGHLEDVLKANARPARGFLLHSYGGSKEMVRTFAKLGGFFSISGYFAHERKAEQREVFKTVPMGRLLIETDAPDMLPPDALKAARLDFQGQEVNHPANIRAIYDFTSALRETPVEELGKCLEANFRALFG